MAHSFALTTLEMMLRKSRLDWPCGLRSIFVYWYPASCRKRSKLLLLVGELFTNTCISCIKITNTKHQKFPESQIIFAELIIIYWIHRKWGDSLRPSLKPSSVWLHCYLDHVIAENSNFTFLLSVWVAVSPCSVLKLGGHPIPRLMQSFKQPWWGPCKQLNASLQWEDFDIKILPPIGENVWQVDFFSVPMQWTEVLSDLPCPGNHEILSALSEPSTTLFKFLGRIHGVFNQVLKEHVVLNMDEILYSHTYKKRINYVSPLYNTTKTEEVYRKASIFFFFITALGYS